MSSIDGGAAMAEHTGWKLVPEQATKAMQDAWDSSPGNEDTDVEFHGAYATMLAAAPEPTCTRCEGVLDEPSYYNPGENELLCNDCAGQLENSVRLVMRNLFKCDDPVGWQYFANGAWHPGLETNNHRENTEAAGIPTRDVYAHPPLAQDKRDSERSAEREAEADLRKGCEPSGNARGLEDRLLAALERAAAAESALRALADECENDAIPGWEDRMAACIKRANELLASSGKIEPPCQTCGGGGWLGGPSFYDPGEGGVPCEDCAPPAQAQAEPVSGADGLPAIFGDEEHVSIPRGLIGAACSAIEHKREGKKVLAELRRYTFGDLSKPSSNAGELQASVDKAWARFQGAMRPTDEELEELAGHFADETGYIHDDAHVEFARALLDAFAKRHMFAAPVDAAQAQPPVSQPTAKESLTVDEREAFVSWLSGEFPEAWPAPLTGRAWDNRHVAALAWQARAALAQQASGQGSEEQSGGMDTARLDFLIDNSAIVASDPKCMPGYWLEYNDGKQVWVQVKSHPTAREAIDAARAEAIASAHPCTVRALLAERDALREVMQKVREVLAADRQALIDTHGADGAIPPEDENGTLGLYEYDCALEAIDTALTEPSNGR